MLFVFSTFGYFSANQVDELLKSDLSEVILESKRLRLAPISTRYTGQIFLEYRLPMTKYMHHPTTGTIEELTTRTKKWEKEIREGERLFMAVLLRETEEFLGCFAIGGLSRKDPEMGGWLKRSAHGNRYGQEAAAAMRSWAQKNINYEHLKWPCALENVASCKVAESLGGIIKKRYKKKNTSGYVWDFVEYWIG